MHNQISRLRRAGLGSALVTLTDAYRLDGAAVDVATVARLREQARATGEPAAAAALLRRACDLWRGEPLGGVGPHLAAAERPGLAALRQSVVEERFDAELAAGKDAELLPELAAAVRAHPYSEPLLRIRMLALARGNQPAAAVRTYDEARALLRAELGIEPSAQLRELAGRLRTHQVPAPSAAAPAQPLPPAPLPPARPLPPAQLPAPPRSFAGRAAELAGLARLLGPGGPPGPRAVLVSGMAGIGKTALALRAAASVAAEYPDGTRARGFRPRSCRSGTSSSPGTTRTARTRASSATSRCGRSPGGCTRTGPAPVRVTAECRCLRRGRQAVGRRAPSRRPSRRR